MEPERSKENNRSTNASLRWLIKVPPRKFWFVGKPLNPLPAKQSYHGLLIRFNSRGFANLFSRHPELDKPLGFGLLHELRIFGRALQFLLPPVSSVVRD